MASAPDPAFSPDFEQPLDAEAFPEMAAEGPCPEKIAEVACPGIAAAVACPLAQPGDHPDQEAHYSRPFLGAFAMDLMV